MNIDKAATQKDMKAKLVLNERCIFLIDILCALFDITILIWTYLNHFTYNKQGYTLTTADNIQRLICLGLSFAVIIFIVIRLFLARKLQIYQYLLHLRSSSNA